MVKDKIKIIRTKIENIIVSIDDIARPVGHFKPDLRCDPRLREKLVKLVELCRDEFGNENWMLPATSVYRPFNPEGGGYHILDAKDPRGHWSGLSADLNYRLVMKYEDRVKFLRFASQVGLQRIWLKKYGEWWHWSRYGRFVSGHPELWEWRPEPEVAKMRWQVLKELKLV